MTTTALACGRRAAVVLCCLLQTGTVGCFTFSSYQSARILDHDQVHSTVAVAHNNFREDRDSHEGWTILEIQRRAPLVPRHVDGSLKFSLLRPDGLGGLGLIMGGDVKAGIWPNRLAVMVPVSVMAGDTEFSSFDCYPTIVGSTRLDTHLEITASASRHFLASHEPAAMNSYTLGVGISDKDHHWSLRPELGWLRAQEAGWAVTQLGIALELRSSGGVTR